MEMALTQKEFAQQLMRGMAAHTQKAPTPTPKVLFLTPKAVALARLVRPLMQRDITPMHGVNMPMQKDQQPVLMALQHMQKAWTLKPEDFIPIPKEKKPMLSDIPPMQKVLLPKQKVQ